jgi:serine/threonine-protein kinase
MHPNIMKLLQFTEDETNYYLITEFFKGGSLLNLFGNSEVEINEPIVINMMYSLLCAVAAAHGHGIIHGRIKASHVFIRDIKNLRKSNYCLGNFGFSSSCTTTEILQHPGFVEMVAPEMLMNVVCPASDIWAIGVLMFMVIYGHAPFPGNSTR